MSTEVRPPARDRLTALGPVLLVVGAFVALVTLAALASMPDLVRGVRGNPDLVAPLALGRATLDITGDDGTAFTGDHSWLIGFWSVTVLDWIGLPTKGILVIPGVLWILTAAYVGLFWWRRGRRFEAIVAFGLLMALGRTMWPLVGSWNGHGGTAHLSVVAAVAGAVGLTRTSRPVQATALVAVAGFAAGLAAGSDLLAVFSAIVPLAVAVAAMHGHLDPRRLRILAAVAVAGLAVGFLGTSLVAHLTDVRGSAHKLFLRPDLLGGLDSLYRSVVVIWSDGTIFSDPVEGGSVTAILAFAAGWGLLIAVFIAGISRVLRGAGGPSVTGAPDGEAGISRDDPAGSVARGTDEAASSPENLEGLVVRPWAAFWLTGLALMPLAFVVTSVSQGASGDYAIGWYLVVWWVAIAALFPLVHDLRIPWLRAGAVVAALIVVGYGGGRLVIDTVDGLGNDDPLYGEAVPQDWRLKVQRAAKLYKATHGYSGYFTSFSLGLGGDEVPVYPVMTCGNVTGGPLCASGVASRPSMYRNESGRSFVVLDARPDGPPFKVVGVPGNRLKPVAFVAIAPNVTMVVYDGDVGRYVFPAFDQTVQNRPPGQP